MLADDTSRLGLVIAAALAILGCGSSPKQGIDAHDGGTAATDLGAKGDWSADNNPRDDDAAADAGTVVADVADVVPEAPLLDRDSAGSDTAINAADAGADTPLPNGDSAGPDITDIGVDAGLDGNTVPQDSAVDGSAQDVAADARGGDAIVGVDGGSVDAGRAALLTISPTDARLYQTATCVFTVSNVGSAASGTFTVTITGQATYFEITSNSCQGPLPAGEECQVVVRFNMPPTSLRQTASLNIEAEGFPDGKFVAQLLGDPV